MGSWFVEIAGTATGQRVALVLALVSALMHASLGALIKGGHDAILNRGAVNIAAGLMALPVAVFMVPWPTPGLWWFIFGMYLVHLVYEWVQARSYQIGGFTVIYPISRGTVPLLIAILSGWLFGEGLSLPQWLGLLVLSGAIYGLAVANMRALGLADLAAAAQLRRAIAMALLTGGLVTAYTLYDAWGIRMADDPFTVIAWFFVSGLFGVPVIAALRWRRMAPAARPAIDALARRGVAGACIAFVSFGGIMLGTRIGNIAEVAAVRETSIVFATLIGMTVFRERLDARRIGLIGLIVAGAVLIKVV